MRPCKVVSLSAVLFAALAGLSPVMAQKRAEPAPEDAFLAARDAAKAGQREKLALMSERFKGHALEMYGPYWQTLPLKGDAAEAAQAEFLRQYDKSYLAERVRIELAKSLAKREAWEAFDAERAKISADDLEIACFTLLRRHQKKDDSAVREALQVWLTPRELPEGCVTLSEALLADSRILDRHVWERIRVLVDAGLPNAARRIADYLPDSQALDQRQFDAAYGQPEKFLKRGAVETSGRTRAQRELVLIALGRWAKNDPAEAAAFWAKYGKKPFNETEHQWGWAQIGYQASRKLMSEADEWFNEASEIQLSDEYLQWMVRAALRARDWKLVQRAVKDMTPAVRRDPAWTYWLARALREEGKGDDARVLFESIAADFSFYGQLAAGELDRPTVIPPVGFKPSKDDMSVIAATPGFQRALSLYRLGMRTEATREWVWTIRGMDDKQLLAAATLARQNDLPDRAINTADKTALLHDFSLRFLSPHAEQVRPKAKELGLDDAWVYGLMRQESRFITSAKSVVGASGLMQLMPATARWVAKKVGLKDYHHGQVNDLDTNITLGTSYLKIVQDELYNHPVLASAAYNAGPGRPRRWRDIKPMEAAVFAESIPFNETRDYVKKVMSNATFYAALFSGKPQSLKDRLAPIPPRRGDEKASDTP
jgi:soluble lytic murein transglycosylase